MRSYPGSDVRNVAVAGHAHCGKTTLIASLLQAAGMTTTQGRVQDGSAATAYDEDEVARGTTMQNAVAFAEWQGVKVNLIDTPGFHIYSHEARAAMQVAEAAVIVVHALAGVEAVTERTWRWAEEFNLPRIVVLNQMDTVRAGAAARETSGGEDVASALLDDLRERWGRSCVPVQLPVFDAVGFRGVVDLVTMQAFLYAENGGTGRGAIAEIPHDLQQQARAAHEALVELVAEGKDELLEEFFEVGTIPEQHLITALHEAIREDRIFPVLFASGLRGVGADHLLDFLKVYAPTAAERAACAGSAIGAESLAGMNAENIAAYGDGAGGHEAVNQHPSVRAGVVMRAVRDEEPLTLFVYKTLHDPFAGRVSFFKVISGVLHNEQTVENYSRGGQERLSHLSVMQGRKAVEVSELHAGDMGAVTRLRETLTGDTLGQRGAEMRLEPVASPEPSMTYAIEPKTRADEDKLGPALHKLMEEDRMLRFFRDAQTQEFQVAGAGQQHIETVVARLKRRFHTEVTLKAPKVPYRETIRARAEAQGRHKKQSGGHGQFGDCRIRLEPLPRGSGFQFASEIFGGAIPRQYVPAVEKGIAETALSGHIAGFPVVDFRATVYDGSYHEVDSNELSFKIAARLAFRQAMEQAKPCLLEPVMRVEIEAPEEYAGALMGDLNTRRGHVLGMTLRGRSVVVEAEVPMAEMLQYGATLTSLTQGRGSFHMEMRGYEVVPTAVAERILATAQRPVTAETE